MKTILVPTDFSATANKALQIAKVIAKNFDATIQLAHFYSINMSDYSYPDISMPQQIQEEINKAAIVEMDKLVQLLNEDGIKSKSVIKMGLTTDSIVDMSKESKADLVVMGTTGTSSLVNKLIGSITANVMEQIEAPILLVPAESNFIDFKRIVYANSMEESDVDVLKNIYSFADTMQTEDISLLNINTSNHYEPVNYDIVKQLTDVFGDEKIKLKFIDADSVKNGIDEFLKRHLIDLVVMSTHKKNLLERIFTKSNTRIMALHSKVPLLIYHKAK